MMHEGLFDKIRTAMFPIPRIEALSVYLTVILELNVWAGKKLRLIDFITTHHNVLYEFKANQLMILESVPVLSAFSINVIVR